MTQSFYLFIFSRYWNCWLQLLSEDSLHMEAYEKLLDTWLSLVSDTDQLATSTIKPFADQIFSTYMMCHISPPNGNRSKVCLYFLCVLRSFFYNDTIIVSSNSVLAVCFKFVHSSALSFFFFKYVDRLLEISLIY